MSLDTCWIPSLMCLSDDLLYLIVNNYLDSFSIVVTRLVCKRLLKALSTSKWDLLKWEAYDCSAKRMAKFARNGDQDRINAFTGGPKPLLHLQPDDLAEIIEGAASYGQLSLLQWLYRTDRMGPDWQVNVVDWAARGGHLPVLGWIVHTFGSVALNTGNIFENAAAGGQLHVLKWLKDTHHLVPSSISRAAIQAAGNGHLDVLNWIWIESKPSDEDSVFITAIIGNELPVIRWLDSKELSKKAEYSKWAAMDANIGILRFLHAKGYPFDPKNVEHILGHLVNHSVNLTAEWRTNLDWVMQVDDFSQFSWFGITKASTQNRTDILEWIYDKISSWPQDKCITQLMHTREEAMAKLMKLIHHK